MPGAGENSPFPEDGTRPRGLDQAAFQAGHELGGVLDHERLKIAIIDGRWLRIGDKVDGCTLTRISGDTVCFECYDGEAVLKPSRGRGAIGD